MCIVDNNSAERFLAYFNRVFHRTHFPIVFCINFVYFSFLIQPRFTEDLLFLPVNSLYYGILIDFHIIHSLFLIPLLLNSSISIFYSFHT